MLKGKNIVLGVTGGIAAYKSIEIVSRLKKKGANVFVVLTKNAGEFVSPLTFQSISQNYVSTDMFETPKSWDVEHISLAKRADIFLIAPATANIIGKIVGGIADDMLTTTVMATKAPVILVPAMNTNMYENEIVQSNISRLKALGYTFIDPESGRLACGDHGVGKMAEPIDIVEYLEAFVSTVKVLESKRVLITAGPTIEPIDPFRYITNHSSGKMGYALAKEAHNLGASVKLISGPVAIKSPSGVDVEYINTAVEMRDAVMADLDFDIIIKAAAVSDFRPKDPSEFKLKKESKDHFIIETVRNPDILAEIGAINKDKPVEKKTYLVGFAAETNNLEEYAIKKLEEKNLDMIVLNDISKENSGFKSDSNTVSIITKGHIEHFPNMSKEEVANIILRKISVELSKV